YERVEAPVSDLREGSMKEWVGKEWELGCWEIIWEVWVLMKKEEEGGVFIVILVIGLNGG
ncbi:hypothetical protein, partial [Bacillus mycoides]|uniref:hypothetical protein n=1 Tax=Bacillus mycoides TaxID=1405 RepID=UPI001C92EA72